MSWKSIKRVFRKSEDYFQIDKCTWLIWTFLNKLSNFFERIVVWRAWISCHLKSYTSGMVWLSKAFCGFSIGNGIPTHEMSLQTEQKTHKSTNLLEFVTMRMRCLLAITSKSSEKIHLSHPKFPKASRYERAPETRPDPLGFSRHRRPIEISFAAHFVRSNKYVVIYH